ncbi:unnamed protein product [Mytilus edulis]|uniref:Uncharacterized protein n=1 Tax=Mytilus edulis TaxID=6550 RepID=A0A8S3RK14_MYTED|nr:unnamed protein product [Mytilus edulis]
MPNKRNAIGSQSRAMGKKRRTTSRTGGNRVQHEEIAQKTELAGEELSRKQKRTDTWEPRESSILKSALQLPKIFKEQIMKEVKLGRIAGPFRYPPFPTLQASPMGLVSKKDGDVIDKDHCSVQYRSVDEAACLINRHTTFARLSQCDVKAAFPLLPIAPHDFDLLGMKISG